MLTVGRSRHLTSGGTAVAHDKIFAQKNKELGLSITGRFPFRFLFSPEAFVWFTLRSVA